MRDVHWCVTVDYQQIENDNIANQIHGFTIDYGKFILNISYITRKDCITILYHATENTAHDGKVGWDTA